MSGVVSPEQKAAHKVWLRTMSDAGRRTFDERHAA
jgi:hypothetical protein